MCYCEGKRESAETLRKDRPMPFSIWKFGNWDSFQTYSWNAQSLTKVYLICWLASNAQYLEFLPPTGDSLLLTEHLASFIRGKPRALRCTHLLKLILYKKFLKNRKVSDIRIRYKCASKIKYEEFNIRDRYDKIIVRGISLVSYCFILLSKFMA